MNTSILHCTITCKGLILLLSLFSYTHSAAIVIDFRQWCSYKLSTDNIYAVNHTRGITQTTDGYIWMGSTNGLCRYDGYSLQRYPGIEEGGDSLLLSNSILSVTNISDRYILAMQRGRIYSMMDVKKGKFVDYTGDGSYGESFQRFIITDTCSILFYDAVNGGKSVKLEGGKWNSRRWALPPRGIVACVNIQKEIYAISPDASIWKWNDQGAHLIGSARSQSIKGKIIEAVYYNGEIWMTDGKAIIAYDIKRQSTRQENGGKQNSHVELDNRNNLIIITDDGSLIYYYLNGEKHLLKGVYNETLLKLHNDGRFRFFSDRHGTLFISTNGNGLFVYDPTDNSITHLTSHDKYPLTDTDYLLSIYVDKADNLWICQENMGIRVLSRGHGNAIYHYFTDNHRRDHSNDIRLLRRVKDKLYIANQYNELKITDGLLRDGKTTDMGENISCAMQDMVGRVWIGTNSGGIYIDGKHFANDINDSTSLSSGKISDFEIDRNGRIWVITFTGGVDMVEIVKDKLTARHLFKGGDALIQPRDMMIDSKGRMWIATGNGAVWFIPDSLLRNKKAYHTVHIEGNAEGRVQINCLFEDSKGRIWLGSAGQGITVNGKKYTIQDGLANNDVKVFAEDVNGRVWIGTAQGISCYDETSFSTYIFASHHLGNICTENNALTLDNNHLAFATRFGIVSFDPIKMETRKNELLPMITEMDVNGVRVEAHPDYSEVNDTVISYEEITLKHYDNSLTFRFSDFDYSYGHNSKFTTWLEGYDDKWTTLSGVNFATYKNLPPGKYKLHMRVSNGNGVWNTHELTRAITIGQPWWNTWFAWICYIITITAVILIAWKQLRRINELRNAVKVEKKMTEFKLIFFTNISHEFRTPLTIIKGAMQRLENDKNISGTMKQPMSSMSKSVDRMMRLVNQLMEFRRMQHDKLQLALEETDVIEFVRDLFDTFRNMAENKRMNYSMTSFSQHFTMAVDKDFMDKILYNLISNAFKYTPSGKSITVSISNNELKKEITISVEDEGIGVKKEDRDKLFTRFNQSSYLHDSVGIGLHLTSALVKAHHGRIDYIANETGGSTFAVTLPTDRSVYKDEDFIKEVDNELLSEENRQEKDGKKRNSIPQYSEMMPHPMNDREIIIVEDDGDVAEFLRRELQVYFNVTTAANGKEALEVMDGKDFDLVITDLMMPVLNGLALVEELKNRKETKDIPIIMLTAITDEEKLVKATVKGVDDFLTKPCSIQVLIAKVVQLIKKREQIQRPISEDRLQNKQTIVTEINDVRLRAALDTWLDKHMNESSLNIDSFAANMGYGRTIFYKQVKILTGMTPNEYIKQKRMTAAADLLLSTNLTIAEIGYRVGIDDQYYFSKLFKAYHGITPSKFRKGEQGQNS